MRKTAFPRKAHRFVGWPAASTVAAVALLVGAAAPAARAQSTITFVTSVTSPQTHNALSGKATLTIVNNGSTQSLLIDFFNTSGPTTNQADTLSTLLFNFASGVTATANGVTGVTTSLLSPIPANTHSEVISSYDGSLLADQTVNGSYVFNTQTTSGLAYKYGVSSAGFSSTTAPAYSFSGFTKGNGGDDYTLVGYGTTGAGTGNISNTAKNAYAVIENGVHIQVDGFTGLTSTSQITGVGFGFASGALTTGGYLIGGGTPLNPVPATPAAASVLIGALVGAVTLGGRRLRRRASAAPRTPAA